MSIAAAYVSAPLPPNLTGCQISIANAARDGSGTLGTVLTAPSAPGLGARVEGVRIIATVTTTAGMVRLFITDGTTTRLIAEVPVTAITPSGTVQAFSADLDSGMFPLILPPGWSLKAGTNNAETFNVIPKLAGIF